MNEIEKAIGYFTFQSKNQEHSEQYMRLCELAAIALEAQQADMWIPISSGRLPEDRGYPPVICCNTEDKWTDAAFVSDHGHFINCEGIIIRPTHWRPLPETYDPLAEKLQKVLDREYDRISGR